MERTESIETRHSDLDLVLQKLEQIEMKTDRLTEALESAPAYLAIFADTFDEAMTSEMKQGVDPVERFGRLLLLMKLLTDNDTIEQLEKLVELSNRLPGLMAIGVDTLDEMTTNDEFQNTVGTLQTAYESFNEAANSEKIKPVGLFGFLRALRDPEMKRSLGFLTEMLTVFGQKLERPK